MGVKPVNTFASEPRYHPDRPVEAALEKNEEKGYGKCGKELLAEGVTDQPFAYTLGTKTVSREDTGRLRRLRLK